MDLRGSRWLLSQDPLVSEEYLGTVVTDPAVLTQLPLYQLFVKSPANMDSDTGTPAPIHFPVRLQLNGQFHELAFHTA